MDDCLDTSMKGVVDGRARYHRSDYVGFRTGCDIQPSDSVTRAPQPWREEAPKPPGGACEEYVHA